jgi:predicted esterase
MQNKYIDVTKRARYFQIGEANSSIKKVWMVFHGYAMLSEFFIKKFNVLNDGKTLIVAPEALNRFYITENFSRVGASWMTKEDRENDILENNRYIESLYRKVVEQIGHLNFELNVLGFSQGSPTGCRWVFSSPINVKNLLIWAGDIPKDTLIEKNKSKWADLNTYLVMGKKDQLITKELSDKFEKIISDYGLNYSLVRYEGDHRIFPDVLKSIADNFKND